LDTPNIIWGNKNGLLLSSPGAKVYNNTIYNNNRSGRGSGILIQHNPSDVQIRNNTIYRNDHAAISGSNAQVTQSHNLINVDPGFIAEASHDFRLRAASPAVNAGAVLSEVRDDIDGVPRSSGSGYTIGAYEYRSNGVPQLPAPRNLKVHQP
jgi:Right handed beta helix region